MSAKSQPQKRQSLKRKKPRILITGGLGFIFSHVTEHFVKLGWDVVVIDNLSVGSHPEIIDGSFEFLRFDVSNKGIIDIIQHYQPNYLIHAAANSDVDHSITEPELAFFSNALSTLWIFEACRNLKDLKRMIYVSTDEVYGECEHRKREGEILWPRNPYALAKAIGSLMRIAYDNSFDALKDKTAETRFCNIFGPRQDERKIIPAIKRALNTGQPLTVHNSGEGYREWLYVKDIPSVIERILLDPKGNRPYNVTANWGMTVKELIDLAQKITGKKIATKKGERKGMDIAYEMSNERIWKDLQWEPRYNFYDAFEAYLKGKPL